MFTENSLVLVQFRQAEPFCEFPGLKSFGTESKEAKQERQERREHAVPLETRLERNGASFANVGKWLARDGFYLERAQVQRRLTVRNKPYYLLTFAFGKDAKRQAGEDVLNVFSALSRGRYEYVCISEGADEHGRLICTIVGKTPAQRAVELEYLADKEAYRFGILVSRAVRKKDRVA